MVLRAYNKLRNMYWRKATCKNIKSLLPFNHDLLPPFFVPAQPEGNSTLGGCGWEHNTPSSPSSLFRAMLSAQNTTTSISLHTGYLLQRLNSRQVQLRGWGRGSTSGPARWEHRPQPQIVHRLETTCWERQAEKARGYCPIRHLPPKARVSLREKYTSVPAPGWKPGSRIFLRGGDRL